MSKIAEGYKQTEVGIIPSDWEVKKLANIAEICTGSTPPTSNQNNYGNDYFFVTPADLGKGRLIQNTEKKLSIKGFNISRKYPKKSILFTCIGSTIGKSGIADKELTSNQQINAIFPNTTFDSDYMYYALNLLSNNIKKSASETAVPIINKSYFGELPIPVPLKAEQTAIATALNDADALITQLEKLIAKKRNIKQGAMQELLICKKRLPGFNEKWEVKKLGDTAEVVMGQSPVGTSYNPSGIGAPLINGPTEFTEKHPIKIQWTSQPTKFCMKGDVLLCVRGSSTGRINISDDEYCIGRGIAAIRAKSGADTSFITFQVESAVKKILALTTGSTFPNIDGKSIKAIAFPIPPLPEQTAIAQILSDMDAEIEVLEKKLEKYKMLKQGMMQNLLTGKIRLV